MTLLKILVKDKADIVWPAFAKVLGVGAQYIIIALFSKFFLEEELGVWVVLSHLMITVSLLDFGMGGGGLRNELIRLQAQEPSSFAQQRLFFASFTVVGCIALALLGLSSVFLPQSAQGLFRVGAGRIFPYAQTIFFFFMLVMLLKMPLALHVSGFYAYREVHLKALCDCVESLLLMMTVGVCILFRATWGQCFAAYYLCLLVVSGGGFFLFLKRRGWRWVFSSFQPALVLLRINLVFWVQNICSIVLFSLTPFLINMLNNVVVAGEYLLIYRVYCLLVGVHFALLNPLWSSYTHAFYLGAFSEMRKRCVYSLKLTLLFLSGGVVLVIFLYQPLIFLWTGKTLECTSVVIATGVWTLLYGVINCLSILLNALNKIHRQILFLFIGSLINSALGIILGRRFGMLGIVIAAIIALIPLLFSNVIEIRSIEDKVHDKAS